VVREPLASLESVALSLARLDVSFYGDGRGAGGDVEPDGAGSGIGAAGGGFALFVTTRLMGSLREDACGTR
jgi:hypothetical protein